MMPQFIMKMSLILMLFMQLKISLCGKVFDAIFLREKIPKAMLKSKLMGNFSFSSEVSYLTLTCSVYNCNGEIFFFFKSVI